MKRALVFVFLLLFVATAVHAGIFVSQPKDKLVSFEKVIMLKGASRNLKILKVNGQKIKIEPNGTFSCGLVLKHGKNYIEVRALDKDGNHFVKKIRVLGLKTYPDIESLYDGVKHWARAQIIYLSTFGYIEGYPDGNYYPGIPVTRGEFATWIARIRKLRIPKLTEDVFYDVPQEHWRAPYIKAVIDAEIMSPYDNQTFGINDPISRRNAANVVVLAEGINVVEKVRPLFIDVPQEEKGALPIYIAKEKGLVKGVYQDIPIFDPDRALTRAEAAVLLARFKRSVNAIKYLFNFAKGFSADNYSQLNVLPEIVSFTAEPKSLRLGEKNVVRLRVKIAPRDAFSPISKVKVNLSEIGGLPDVEMYDNGVRGDEIAGDLEYSLNISAEPKESGRKMLAVTVIDRLGWESNKQTSLIVLE